MRATTDSRASASTWPVTTVAVLAVLFAMRSAQSIVNPLLTAFFLAMAADSGVVALEKRGMPRSAGVAVVVSAITLMLFAIAVVVGSSVQELSSQAPAYEEQLNQKITSVLEGVGNGQIGGDAAGVFESLSPDAAFGLASGFLGGVGELFSNSFLILFLVIFLLFEIPSLTAKLEALDASREIWDEISRSVRGYLVIKSLTSLATGFLVAVMLTLLDIDFAILWGLLAFLLNFVPNIGSILAAIPAVLLALLLNGTGSAIAVSIGYMVINTTIGNVVEPRIMGKGLGLSTLVVFLSLVVWGWLLGSVGMLLSVPLTTTLKIALASREATRPIAVLMGSTVPDGRGAAPPTR